LPLLVPPHRRAARLSLSLLLRLRALRAAECLCMYLCGTARALVGSTSATRPGAVVSGPSSIARGDGGRGSRGSPVCVDCGGRSSCCRCLDGPFGCSVRSYSPLSWRGAVCEEDLSGAGWFQHLGPQGPICSRQAPEHRGCTPIWRWWGGAAGGFRCGAVGGRGCWQAAAAAGRWIPAHQQHPPHRVTGAQTPRLCAVLHKHTHAARACLTQEGRVGGIKRNRL
jgi:hypothetical protein